MSTKKEMERYAKRLGSPTFKSHQVKAIQSICGGEDTFVVSAPGPRMRAIIFAAALSNEAKPIVVIEPTISSINEAMRELLALDEPIEAVSLTAHNRDNHNELLRRFKNHDISIMYITPEVLQKKRFQKAMQENVPWLVVVNECHQVLEWVGSFTSSYLEIKAFVNSLPQRPTMLAMTATAPPDDRKAICKRLGMIDPKEIILSVDKPNLSIVAEEWGDPHESEANLDAQLYCVKRIILKYCKYGGAIIYAPTPRDVIAVAEYLEDEFDHGVVMSHNKMPKKKRMQNEWMFMRGMCSIMVATSDFSQVIDNNGISLIIHFGLPLSVVDYYQQIRRAGKDGRKAYSVVIFDNSLIRRNENLISSAPKAAQKKMKKRQKEIKDIFTGDNCFKQGLLKALGEKSDNCGHCSACLWKEETENKSGFWYDL